MMKLNLVSTASQSLSFLTLIQNPTDVITLDSIFFIPSDRSEDFPQARRFKFDNFKSIWLEPLFNTLPQLAIHEEVYMELFKQCKLRGYPCCLANRVLTNKPITDK